MGAWQTTRDGKTGQWFVSYKGIPTGLKGQRGMARVARAIRRQFAVEQQHLLITQAGGPGQPIIRRGNAFVPAPAEEMMRAVDRPQTM